MGRLTAAVVALLIFSIAACVNGSSSFGQTAALSTCRRANFPLAMASRMVTFRRASAPSSCIPSHSDTEHSEHGSVSRLKLQVQLDPLESQRDWHSHF